MPILSIVIPVYNSERYLHKCLDSILAQSFEDYEVLLVNDGSTDSSPEICSEYSRLDSRFITINIKNQGVSHARNIGIDNSSGYYVTFIDSDDYIEPITFEKYVNAFSVEEEIDAVKIGYFQEIENEGQRIVATPQDHIFENKSDLFKYLEETNYYSFVWNICLKKDKLKSLKFNEKINWLEDHIFSYQYYFQCNKVMVLALPLYHYMVRSTVNSLSNISNPDIIAKAMDLEYDLKMRLNANKYKDIEIQINQNYLHNLHRLVDVLYHNNFSNSEKIEFTRISLKVKNLLYKEEKIFFNSYIPFVIRDLMIQTFYKIRKQRQA